MKSKMRLNRSWGSNMNRALLVFFVLAGFVSVSAQVTTYDFDAVEVTYAATLTAQLPEQPTGTWVDTIVGTSREIDVTYGIVNLIHSDSDSDADGFEEEFIKIAGEHGAKRFLLNSGKFEYYENSDKKKQVKSFFWSAKKLVENSVVKNFELPIYSVILIRHFDEMEDLKSFELSFSDDGDSHNSQFFNNAETIHHNSTSEEIIEVTTDPVPTEMLCLLSTTGHEFNIGVYNNQGVPRLVDRETCSKLISFFETDIETNVCHNGTGLQEYSVSWGEETILPTKQIDCTPETVACRESDSGKEYAVQGDIWGINYDSPRNTVGGNNDFCINTNTLAEFYCEDANGWKREDVPCPNGCSDGACIEDTPQTVNDLSFNINKVVGRGGSAFRVDIKNHGTSSTPIPRIFMHITDTTSQTVLQQEVQESTVFVADGFEEGTHMITFNAHSLNGPAIGSTLSFEIIGQNEQCILLEENNPGNSAVTMVFLAPFNETTHPQLNYTQDEFTQKVQEEIAVFFEIEPYKSYRSQFNVKIVNHDLDLDCTEAEGGISGILKPGCDKHISLDLAHEVCGSGETILFLKSRGASYGALLNSGDGFDNSLAVIAEGTPFALGHEFAHTFALLADEYLTPKAGYSRLAETRHRNCDTILDGIACPLWCGGPAKTVDSFLAVSCSGLALEECELNAPCVYLKDTDVCVNSLECTTNTTQTECEEFGGEAVCQWLTPENSLFEDVPPKFYNSFCVPVQVPAINIGTECQEGTGCFAGCSAKNSYRSVENGRMGINANEGEFGPINTSLICQRLEQKTGTTHTVCNQ
jgi:hypothetical protein